MRRIKQFFLLLCLLVAGAQSTWAMDGYTFYRSCTFQNFTFLLYTYSGDITLHPDLAVLAGINGTDENVTVPNYIEDGGTKYYVECGLDTISNNYVKTLTFQRSYYFHKSVSSTSEYYGHDFNSYLSCPQLTKIVFEGSVTEMNWAWMGTGTAPHLLCENLTDIFFMGYAPTLSGNWSNYCTAPAGNITVHVAEWTAEQCQDKHAHANVWSEFAAVVPCSGISETVNVTASVSAGGAFQISGESALTNGSQTYEAEKYSGLTFFAYPSSTDYLVAHVYVNGTDVISQMTTQSDGKLKYTIANLQDDVTISVVGEEAHVTVTASVSDGGRFQQSGGQALTSGSQEYEVDTHSTFTFLAFAADDYQVDHVYLNGRDIIGEMEQLSNGKLRYTIEDIRDDVYISVTGESLYEDAWVSVSPGGKVTYTKNNVPTNITSSAYVRINNGSTQDLFIIPNEGYELDKYWIGSPYPMQDFTETTGLLALEPQEDGSYKLTIDHGFNILFTFKKTGITDGMVTVSASVSGGGRFQKSGGQELTYGSQEYVVDGHSDFTFTVSAGNSSQVAHVYLNGRDIIGEMEQLSNGKLKYTIEDMCDNVYISVVGESTIQTAYITTTPGGKVTYTKNDVPKEIATWDYVEFPVDSSLDLFIVPDEGYELEKYWIEGPPIQDFTETTGMLALVPQDDGSYKLTIDHGFSLLFTFKAKETSCVHVQVVGSPENVAYLQMRNVTSGGSNEDIFFLPFESLASLNRTDILTVGTEYQLKLIGAQNANLKRVTINGEEVAVTGTTNKTVPARTLGEYDDFIVVEFEDEPVSGPGITKHVVLNPDGMTLTTFITHKNNGDTSEPFTDDYHLFQFDDTDRTNYTSAVLRVPIDEGRAVRVMRNGMDITYQYTAYDEESSSLCYPIDMANNYTWEILYESRHRQTIVLLGGQLNYSEANFSVMGQDVCIGINKGETTVLDIPDYNVDVNDRSFELSFAVKEGETMHAFRNGVEVPISKFTKNGLNYKLSDYNYAGETQQAFGFVLRDPATWVIIVDDGSGKYDVNGDGEINVSDVTALVNKILHP
ncbi:MAG: hypothetical protein IK000_04445 [Bacteroidaceae bacterium]|nr:hypothetical protein [Bacteroidaceae bacterium]